MWLWFKRGGLLIDWKKSEGDGRKSNIWRKWEQKINGSQGRRIYENVQEWVEKLKWRKKGEEKEKRVKRADKSRYGSFKDAEMSF